MRAPCARTGRTVRLRVGVIAALATTLVPITACSDDGATEGPPSQVLASAKQKLDDTSGVSLALTAKELPDGVDGVLEAKGVGTHAPAFEGKLTVVVNGLDVDVPVVSVDGKVYARLPFTVSFAEVNPADYGAPDPAQLMDPDRGLSSWLTEATGVKAGDRVRDGKTVLSSYVGTLPGSVVDASIPSADEQADFPVTFLVDQDGQLRSVRISGPFYGSKGTVDYTVTVDDYGTEKDIEKP